LHEPAVLSLIVSFVFFDFGFSQHQIEHHRKKSINNRKASKNQPWPNTIPISSWYVRRYLLLLVLLVLLMLPLHLLLLLLFLSTNFHSHTRSLPHAAAAASPII
jgi:hypothetical protein